MSTITVRPYRLTTTGTIASSGTATGSFDPSWTDLFGEQGTGTFVIPSALPPSGMGLDGLDLLQGLIDGVPAWVLYPDPAEIVTVGQGGAGAMRTSLSGPGHLGVLDRGRIRPAGDVESKPKQTTRPINWTSPDYDISGLDTAKVILLTQYAKVTWAGAPFGIGWAQDFPLDGFSVIYWADNPLGNPSNQLEADPGECWFFRDVDYPRDGLYRHFAAADDFLELFLDSVSILQTDTYTQTTTNDVEVSAGTHRWAIRARNGQGNALDFLPGAYVGPGGISLELAEITLIGLNWIGLPSTDLKVIAYADQPPGVTWGFALGLALDEEEAAGGFVIGRTFDAVNDSNGNPWDAELDIATAVGNSLADFVREGTVYADHRMDPDLSGGLVLHAYRKGEAGGASGEILSRTTNLIGLSHRRENLPVTVLLVEWSGGWFELEDAPGVAAYGRSVATLSLGDAPSESAARVIAQAELDRLKAPREEIDATTRHDVVPYVDVDAWDTVTVPDSGGTAQPEVLLGVGVRQVNNVAEFTWIFRDVVLGPAEREQVMVRRLGG